MTEEVKPTPPASLKSLVAAEDAANAAKVIKTEQDDFSDIYLKVLEEVERQDAKWGLQNHPNGTGGPDEVVYAQRAKDFTNARAAEGNVTWLHILEEEVAETFAESEPEKILEELIQAIAVSFQWHRSVERNGADSSRVKAAPVAA